MNIIHEGTDIIGYYCMCIYFVLNKYYYIIILYGGSHASDILHVLMEVSVAKLIIYNIILLFICHNKRSSSSSCNVNHQHFQSWLDTLHSIISCSHRLGRPSKRMNKMCTEDTFIKESQFRVECIDHDEEYAT